jgi:hypothetical protein
MMALILAAHGQQTGVAGDLAAGKIGADGLMTVEGEGRSSDRIGMMHTNHSDYLRTRRAQVAVNYSNSLDF